MLPHPAADTPYRRVVKHPWPSALHLAYPYAQEVNHMDQWDHFIMGLGYLALTLICFPIVPFLVVALLVKLGFRAHPRQWYED